MNDPSSAPSLTVGSSVPAFDLPAVGVDSGAISTKSFLGAPFVVYFYPKDDTPGCTTEACDFRDNRAHFADLNATIVGISKDPIDAHEKFQKKYDLPFILASDAESDVCERFGVWVEKNMYGRRYWGIERATFLMDKDGIVRHIWRKVNVKGHVDEVRAALATLS